MARQVSLLALNHHHLLLLLLCTKTVLFVQIITTLLQGHMEVASASIAYNKGLWLCEPVMFAAG